MNINYKQLYLDHFDASLDIEEFNDGYDVEMSVECTADGYSIYVCRYHGESIIIDEHVFYYAHDLTDKLKEFIQDGHTIYCSEEIFDENYIEDEWEQWCEDAGLIEWNDDEDKYEIVGEDE